MGRSHRSHDSSIHLDHCRQMNPHSINVPRPICTRGNEATNLAAAISVFPSGRSIPREATEERRGSSHLDLDDPRTANSVLDKKLKSGCVMDTIPLSAR